MHEHRHSSNSGLEQPPDWHKILHEEATRKSLAARFYSDGLTIIFCPTIELTLNVGARRSEANFRVRACVKRYNPTIWAENKDHLWARYVDIDREQSSKLRNELHDIVNLIMRKPLTPKMVCEALGITAVERLRLSRAGTLTKEGQGTFNSSERKGYFSMYSAACVRSYINFLQ